ncbi:MAG: hypothetical protein ACWGQW_22035 [bacterium]
MYPTEEEPENDFNGVLEILGTSRAAIDHSLRMKLEALCLEELEKSCNHLGRDNYPQIEGMLLRIVRRIAEPLLGQIKEVNGNPIRQAHGLRMITDAFELRDVQWR